MTQQFCIGHRTYSQHTVKQPTCTTANIQSCSRTVLQPMENHTAKLSYYQHTVIQQNCPTVNIQSYSQTLLPSTHNHIDKLYKSQHTVIQPNWRKCTGRATPLLSSSHYPYRHSVLHTALLLPHCAVPRLGTAQSVRIIQWMVLIVQLCNCFEHP